MLYPNSRYARYKIRRDSAIVGGFILIHVGSRFLGESVQIALQGGEPFQPFASTVSNLWLGFRPPALVVFEHVFFWTALGTILLFIPYFLYSKHLHLFFAPINFLLKPERRSMGQLDKMDFEDESIEQFGATRIEDLEWSLIMDAYACIMCYRCQEVCPAYITGKVLSPAAMEINKRYYLNEEGARLASGESSQKTLTEFAITREAVWACTACGACVDICPVGNEPMRDILNIRRALVLMENDFPEQLQTASGARNPLVGGLRTVYRIKSTEDSTRLRPDPERSRCELRCSGRDGAMQRGFGQAFRKRVPVLRAGNGECRNAQRSRP
jgi:ferredoxin